MASGGSMQGFVLKGVTSLNRKELGRGAYGKVYAVKYCQAVCAAKEIHSILIEDVGETERRLIIESFFGSVNNVACYVILTSYSS